MGATVVLNKLLITTVDIDNGPVEDYTLWTPCGSILRMVPHDHPAIPPKSSAARTILVVSCTDMPESLLARGYFGEPGAISWGPRWRVRKECVGSETDWAIWSDPDLGNVPRLDIVLDSADLLEWDWFQEAPLP